MEEAEQRGLRAESDTRASQAAHDRLLAEHRACVADLAALREALAAEGSAAKDAEQLLSWPGGGRGEHGKRRGRRCVEKVMLREALPAEGSAGKDAERAMKGCCLQKVVANHDKSNNRMVEQSEARAPPRSPCFAIRSMCVEQKE
eukprot:1150770-Pelagomonas_calceolata.AAC.6